MKPVILLVLLVAAALLLTHSLIERPAIQSYILKEISRITGYHIRVGKIELDLWGGLGVKAEDVSAASDSGVWSLDAELLTLHIDVASLLKGELVPRDVSLYKPKIQIVAAQPARHLPKDPTDPLERILESMPIFPGLIIREGSVNVRGAPYSMEGLYVHILLEQGEGREGQRVVLNGKLVKADSIVPFEVSGTSTIKGSGGLLLDMDVKVEAFPFEWIPWPDAIAMEAGRGTARFHVKSGNEGGLTAEGNMTAVDLSFSVIESGISKDYRLRRILIDFDASYLAGLFKVRRMQLSGRDYSLSVVWELDINNAPSPYFFLRVEAPYMPVAALKRIAPTCLLPEWMEAELSPSLSRGFVRVDGFQLDGTVEQIENLTRPENSGVLSMDFTWKGLDVAPSGGGLPFEKVSGSVKLEGGRLHIRGVKGLFALSSVNVASMVVNNIYHDSPSYVISVQGFFNIQDLLRQREAVFVPRNLRHYLRRIEPVAGSVKADVSVLYREGMPYPRMIEGDFFFEGCTATQRSLFYPLAFDELHLVIKKGAPNTVHAGGQWGPLVFTAAGSVADGWKSGSVRIEAEAAAGTMAHGFAMGKGFNLNPGEATTGRFSLSWHNTGLSCRGSVNLDEMTFKGPHFALVAGDEGDRVDFSMDLDSKNRLHIRTLSGHLGTSTLELKGTYDLNRNRFLHVTLSTPSLLVSDLGLRWETGNIGAEGVISGRLKITPRGPDSPGPLIAGSVTGRDIFFALPDLPSPVRGGSFTARFQGNKVTIPSMEFRAGASDLSARGELEGWNHLKGTLSARSMYLRFSDFFDFREESESAGTGAEMNRFWRGSDILMDLNFTAGRWRELDLGTSQAECRLKDGELHVSRSRLNLEYGRVDLKAHVAPEEGDNKYLEMDFRLANQPLGEVLDSFELGRDAIEGRLFLTGMIRMEGRDTHDLLASMDGNAVMGLEEGKIRKSNILLKVLNFLSLRHIFQSVPEDLPKEGFYYKIISSTMDIRGGVVRSEDFFMKSPVFDALGRGEVDLGADRLDFDLGISPLGTIDDLLNRIPVVGYILTGEEKSVLVYYFKVKGPLSAPETTYIPLKKLGGNTVDFFKRLLKTPVLIYREITGEKEGREAQ